METHLKYLYTHANARTHKQSTSVTNFESGNRISGPLDKCLV